MYLDIRYERGKPTVFFSKIQRFFESQRPKGKKTAPTVASFRGFGFRRTVANVVDRRFFVKNSKVLRKPKARREEDVSLRPVANVVNSSQCGQQ
jgi:hypothetical protein